MNSKFKNNILAENGATMVEFSLVSILMFSLVTGIFDIAIVLRNHSLLTTATQQGARVVATQYYANRELQSCDQIAKNATENANQYLQRHAGQTAGNVRFSPAVQFRESYSGQLVSYLVVESTLEAQCLFCKAIPGGIQLAAKSEVVMEDPSFNCIEE